MKSRKVNRFLAILGTCAIVLTSTPITAYATESVDPNTTPAVTEQEEVKPTDANQSNPTSVVTSPSPVKEEVGNEEVTPSTSPVPTTSAEIKSPIEVIEDTAIKTGETAAGNAVSTPAPKAVLTTPGAEVSASPNPSAEASTSPAAGAEASTSPATGTETSPEPSTETSPEPEKSPEPPRTIPKVEADELSGLNTYYPIESELTIEGDIVTDFTPILSQDYDAISVPGTVNGNPVKYGTNFLNKIGSSWNNSKGIIFESGATLATSSKEMKIPYVRFNDGAKAVSASSTFEGWEELTSVVGFGEALAAYGNTDVNFNKTFNGCSSLRNVVLNIDGLTTTFSNTFYGIENIKSIKIENGTVNSISNLNPSSYDWYGISNDRAKRTVTFSNITFPSNDTAYLSHAFTHMNGNIIFNNCNASGSSLLNFDEACAGGEVVPYTESADKFDDYYTWEYGSTYNPVSGDNYVNSTVKISGTSAYSAKSMFESTTLKNVDLTGFITSDTKAVDKMFKGSTLAYIKGIDSWRLGDLTADEMFASTRVYYGNTSYLTKTLVPQIKKLDWSKCTSANKMFNFTYKGPYTIDYSKMNLAGVTDMTISGLPNYDFITAGTNPSNYVFEQDTVYALRASSALGGKALNPIAVEGGKVSGSDIPTDTHVYTDIATISITNVATNKEVSTAVVPGYKLVDYIGTETPYYQDKSLTQPVATDLTVSSGDKITIYCNIVKDTVNRDIIEDSDVDFGESPENVDVKLEDGSTDKLQGGEAELTIKIEDTEATDTTMVIPTDGVAFAKSAFFNIDLIATVGGVDKKVTEMSQKATIVLPLPADYTTGDVKVLNYHDGYDKAPIVIDTTVDKTAKTVTFETDKFSPYVMLYDDSVETDTVDITIKWSGDSRDKTGRSDVTIEDTVTYENNSTTTVSATYTATAAEDETKITLRYPKTLGGSAFKSHSFSPVSDIEVPGYVVTFDGTTNTYEFIYSGSDVTEEVTITIDYSKVSDSDYSTYLTTLSNDSLHPGEQLLTLNWVYTDNTADKDIISFKPDNTKRVFTAKATVSKKTAAGKTFSKYTSLVFNGDAMASGYDTKSDLNTFTLTRIPKATPSTEKNNHNFVVKVVDNNNEGKTRPNKILVEFTANYGDYIYEDSVEVNLAGVSGNIANGTIPLPVSMGGVGLTSITATTNTGTNIGYSSTWDATNMLLKYVLAGATDADPDPTVVIDPVDVFVTFTGDTAVSRPQKVVITAVDSKGGNAVNKEVDTRFSAGITTYKGSVQRLVNDTYHVISVTGIDATKYDVTYSGMTVTAKYKTNTTPQPDDSKLKRKVTIKMEDSNNEDGLRPKSMKITVTNKDGSDTVTSDITVSEENSFTYEVDVKNPNDEYKVKSVSGLPESYEVTMDGLTVTCKHKVEKITKTFKVAWEGDNDNSGKTRPESVQLTIKNGDKTVKTANVSADTNWSVNVELNKLIKGVEASYTVEGADVTNYSKSTSGDTVTYKFSGTLPGTQDPAKSNTADGNGTGEGEEPTYDVTLFDWIDYANRYPDVKKAYGYNKELLYAHYIRYGIAEGRIATFTGKYATVNEDVLKAYFPEDYKYKTNLTPTNPEYLIGAEPGTTSSTTTSTTDNTVTVDSEGNVHTKVNNGDGTTTETVTDADGNIISVSTYKTGDIRLEDLSVWFIVLGVLLLAVAAMIVGVVVKDDKHKKAVLSLIS